MTEPTDPLEGLIEPTEPEDHSPLEKPGNKIGPYRLLQVLGSGGMGEVWLAERREPYVQRVALKVVKPGMDTKAVLSRFEQERQVLAQMSHPNIAKVLDAGVNEQGRPYFVMEYVPGKPITEFADEQKLSIQVRLEYFMQVCNAIAHAHQKGVIHRDIKPGNILVSRGEIGEVGTGSSITTGSSAKVIDFGVAKAMAGGMTQQTVYTQIGEGIGTWGYMSPEQIEGDTQTPSDVYSLGVLLYELMCGERPYDISTMRNFSPKERADFIRGVEILPPSKRLLDLIPQQKRRSISAVGQANELRELDWVCLKALSPDIKGRYLSVHSLAEDVQRFISGEQVEAAPMSIGIQIRRFWRRNSVAVVATVSAIFLLSLVGVFVGIQIDNNQRLKLEASEALDKSQKQEILNRAQNQQLKASAEALEEVKDSLFRAKLSQATALSDISPVTTGLRGDTYWYGFNVEDLSGNANTELQAWGSIVGSGATETSKIDGEFFSIRTLSLCGRWALLEIQAENDENKFVIVRMQDGMPEVVSEVPRSLIPENRRTRSLLLSECESGSVFIASVSYGKVRFARYEPRSGPIEEASVREIVVEGTELKFVWESKGAFLLEVNDISRSDQFAILDLEELPLDALLDHSALVYFGKIDPDVPTGESSTDYSFVRSDSSYTVTALVQGGGQQKILVADVQKIGGNTSQLNDSSFDLPQSTYGVVDFCYTNPSRKVYVKSTLDGKDSLFVFDLEANNTGKEKSNLVLTNSVDLSKHEIFYSSTGVYCEPSTNSGIYQGDVSFVISADSAQTAGLDAPVIKSNYLDFMGISDSHLNFVLWGSIDDVKGHFLSVPRPVGSTARTWIPPDQNGSAPVDSSCARLHTWRINQGHDGSTDLREALEWSSGNSDPNLVADDRLPPNEFVCDFFVHMGHRFIITDCRNESSVRIYQIIEQQRVLKAEFLSSSTGVQPRVTYDLENGRLFVLEQSSEDETTDEDDLQYLSLSLSVFMLDDLAEPILKYSLASDLLSFEFVDAILFDQQSDLFWCITREYIYYFSQDDLTLYPLIGPINASFAGKPLLIPGTRFLVTSVADNRNRPDSMFGDLGCKSWLYVIAFDTTGSENGSLAPRLLVEEAFHVGPHDDISIEIDPVQNNKARTSLVIWRQKSNSTPIDIHSYLQGGISSIDPPLPWDPDSRADENYTKLKWPLFDLNR